MARVWTLTAAVSLALTAALGATVTVGADFRQIVAESTLIVRGHVTDLRTAAPAGGPVETVATVAVDATIKGTADVFISIRVPGGDVGRYRVVAVGAPHFVTGEVAEFFLKTGRDNILRPVGLSLGVYPVALDPQSGQTAITPPLAIGLTASAGPVVHGDPTRRLMTISEFESLVRAVLAAQPRVSPRGGKS
jgi:hypothetical protein